jgi:hypothetical protein
MSGQQRPREKVDHLHNQRCDQEFRPVPKPELFIQKKSQSVMKESEQV